MALDLLHFFRLNSIQRSLMVFISTRKKGSMLREGVEDRPIHLLFQPSSISLFILILIISDIWVFFLFFSFLVKFMQLLI